MSLYRITADTKTMRWHKVERRVFWGLWVNVPNERWHEVGGTFYYNGEG